MLTMNGKLNRIEGELFTRRIAWVGLQSDGLRVKRWIMLRSQPRKWLYGGRSKTKWWPPLEVLERRLGRNSASKF
ncbi:MAG: hypothetical protein ACTS44_00400 [Candidatus Hodgkinia cicadicola]